MAQKQNTDLFLVMGAVHRGTSDWVRANLPNKSKQSVLALSILKYLNVNPGIAQGELGEILRRDPMTMSQAIRALHLDGMISSQTDKEDKRIKRLSLSKKGTATAKGIFETEERILSSLNKNWGKAKVSAFTKNLNEMDNFLSEFLGN